MNNVTLKTVLIAIALTAAGHAAAGGRPDPGVTPPKIMKVAVDNEQNGLIITGRNFGDTSPTVRLADKVLDVKRSSENEIIASLPLGIEPATYGLTVTTAGRNRVTSHPFSVTVPEADGVGRVEVGVR
jgi:hypothetical protein